MTVSVDNNNNMKHVLRLFYRYIHIAGNKEKIQSVFKSTVFIISLLFGKAWLFSSLVTPNKRYLFYCVNWCIE